MEYMKTSQLIIVVESCTSRVGIAQVIKYLLSTYNYVVLSTYTLIY